MLDMDYGTSFLAAATIEDAPEIDRPVEADDTVEDIETPIVVDTATFDTILAKALGDHGNLMDGYDGSPADYDVEHQRRFLEWIEMDIVATRRAYRDYLEQVAEYGKGQDVRVTPQDEDYSTTLREEWDDLDEEAQERILTMANKAGISTLSAMDRIDRTDTQRANRNEVMTDLAYEGVLVTINDTVREYEQTIRDLYRWRKLAAADLGLPAHERDRNLLTLEEVDDWNAWESRLVVGHDFYDTDERTGQAVRVSVPSPYQRKNMRVGVFVEVQYGKHYGRNVRGAQWEPGQNNVRYDDKAVFNDDLWPAYGQTSYWQARQAEDPDGYVHSLTGEYIEPRVRDAEALVNYRSRLRLSRGNFIGPRAYLDMQLDSELGSVGDHAELDRVLAYSGGNAKRIDPINELDFLVGLLDDATKQATRSESGAYWAGVSVPTDVDLTRTDYGTADEALNRLRVPSIMNGATGQGIGGLMWQGLVDGTFDEIVGATVGSALLLRGPTDKSTATLLGFREGPHMGVAFSDNKLQMFTRAKRDADWKVTESPSGERFVAHIARLCEIWFERNGVDADSLKTVADTVYDNAVAMVGGDANDLIETRKAMSNGAGWTWMGKTYELGWIPPGHRLPVGDPNSRWATPADYFAEQDTRAHEVAFLDWRNDARPAVDYDMVSPTEGVGQGTFTTLYRGDAMLRSMDVIYHRDMDMMKDRTVDAVVVPTTLAKYGHRPSQIAYRFRNMRRSAYRTWTNRLTGNLRFDATTQDYYRDGEAGGAQTSKVYAVDTGLVGKRPGMVYMMPTTMGWLRDECQRDLARIGEATADHNRLGVRPVWLYRALLDLVHQVRSHNGLAPLVRNRDGYDTRDFFSEFDTPSDAHRDLMIKSIAIPALGTGDGAIQHLEGGKYTHFARMLVNALPRLLPGVQVVFYDMLRPVHNQRVSGYNKLVNDTRFQAGRDLLDNQYIDTFDDNPRAGYWTRAVVKVFDYDPTHRHLLEERRLVESDEGIRSTIIYRYLPETKFAVDRSGKVNDYFAERGRRIGTTEVLPYWEEYDTDARNYMAEPWFDYSVTEKARNASLKVKYTDVTLGDLTTTSARQWLLENEHPIGEVSQGERQVRFS